MTTRGLVLGSGGALGFAWTIGALTALEEVEGFDCREADMIIGTSAGSIAGALLACGVPVEVLLRHQRGIPAPGDPQITYDENPETPGALPPRPALTLGSPSLLVHTARHPLTVTPFTALASMLPRGTGSMEPVRQIIAGALAESGGDWAPHPSLWVVATDYEMGKRVPFGRPGAPEASLPDAVAASCAIPGWFAPVTIGGHPYVDGGTCSPTSLDLLAGRGLDEVFVIAPMISFALDRPSSLVTRIERRVRRFNTRRMLREAEKVRASGTRVTMLGPGAKDLEVIGANMMDATRRDAVLVTALQTCLEALRRDTDPNSIRLPAPEPDSTATG